MAAHPGKFVSNQPTDWEGGLIAVVTQRHVATVAGMLDARKGDHTSIVGFMAQLPDAFLQPSPLERHLCPECNFLAQNCREP